MRLSGKTILNADGTSGIGLELASQLSEFGNRIIVAGHDPAKLEAALRNNRGYSRQITSPKLVQKSERLRYGEALTSEEA
jgi:short-subunit dehydrogenase involved in D-alanine esterification of teichoic acids